MLQHFKDLTHIQWKVNYFSCYFLIFLGPTRDIMAEKVRGMAEKYDRKFYIMYDVSGWTDMEAQIKQDWTEKMSKHTSSKAYAM